MSKTTIQNLIDAVNHNADLLEKHFQNGVYVHKQIEPSKVWAVNHQLGSLRPHIETYDMTGNLVGHGVNRENQTFDYCEIIFAIPMSGVAILRF